MFSCLVFLCVILSCLYIVFLHLIACYFLVFQCLFLILVSYCAVLSCLFLCYLVSCLVLYILFLSFSVLYSCLLSSILLFYCLVYSCLFLSIYLFIISSSSPTILEYLKTSVCSALASLLKNLDRNNNYLKTFFHRYFSPFVLKIFQSVCIKYISVSLY